MFKEISIADVISLLVLGGTFLTWARLKINTTLTRATTDIVRKELMPNSGGSIKDQVAAAARDSADAKVNAAKALELAKTGVAQNEELKQGHDSLKKSIQLSEKHVDSRFSHLVIHIIKNDLNSSKMLREAQRIIAAEEAAAKSEAERQGRD